ncbi:unnamed protein product [Owenia fusiformis]|uniref:Cytochrome P450 n=1 Tax=Owenia fusiformis TaxID=6347 RepID=A0A8S4Q181_OWEFU|nr:unnamed protein product [Owenia fusiformis]
MTTTVFILWTMVLGGIGFLLIQICSWLYQMKKQIDFFETFPGPKLHWIYGNLHQNPGPNQKGLDWRIRHPQMYGNVYRLYYSILRPVLNLDGPEVIKAAVKSGAKKVLTGPGYRYFYPWLGDGLLVSKGAKWFRNRRLLTPAFHFDILKPYTNVYNTAAEKLGAKFDRVCDKCESFEIFGPVSLGTLDVMLTCAFSYNQNIQEIGDDHPYVKAVKGLANLLLKRFFNPIMDIDWLYYRTADGKRFLELSEFTHSVSENIIKERRKNLKQSPGSNKGRLDFLDILLSAKDETGKGLDDIEIRDEVETFLFEGHDTTASAISWTLYSLAQYPECLAKVQEELDDVIGQDVNQPIKWEDLANLNYLTLCIKEGMRLHSPVPFIGRITDKEIVLEGRKIPPGIRIDMNLYMVHHNPNVWGDDHMEFKPERFEIDNRADKDSYAFIPFSAGPRSCIGQNFAMNEMKVVIGRIVHKYNISVDETHVIEKVPELIMRAKDGIKLFVTSREKM